jgi:hypothetical protein
MTTREYPGFDEIPDVPFDGEPEKPQRDGDQPPTDGASPICQR